MVTTHDDYVRPFRPPSEEVTQLAVMDQLMPRRHMSYLLCFRITSTHTHQTVVRQLQTSLSAVLTEMPQFAGALRKAESSNNELELVLSPYSTVLFRTADRSTEAEYDRLLPSMIEGPLLADDQLAMPAAMLATSEGGTRAFAVQATLVRGGLLLATSIHHSLADARATEVLFDSWARHTAENPQTRKDPIRVIDDSATARWRLSYGPRNVSPDAFLELSGPKETYCAAKTANQVVASTWMISPQALQELKGAVASTSDVPVSESDLICALIARHVYKARKQHETPSTAWPKEVLLYVTSDMRSRLEPPLAKEYLGNASVAVPVAVDLTTLLDESSPASLGQIASRVKRAIDQFDTQALRSRLAFYKERQPYGSVVPNFEYYPGPNMLITDSSSMGFYSLKWGAGLQPIDQFRSVGQTHSVGQCALNPRRRDGSIEMQMRHDLRVVESLREDVSFSKICVPQGCY